MAIRGSLKEASLPDVLQLLSMGKKTGCLSVGHRGSFGYIFYPYKTINALCIPWKLFVCIFKNSAARLVPVAITQNSTWVNDSTLQSFCKTSPYMHFCMVF